MKEYKENNIELEIENKESNTYKSDSLSKSLSHNSIIKRKNSQEIDLKKNNKKPNKKGTYINLENDDSETFRYNDIRKTNACDDDSNQIDNIISGKSTTDDEIVKETTITLDNIYTYENIFTKKPCRLGSCYSFLWIKGSPLIVIGPHWPFFLCLNSIIMGISLTYFYFLWNKVYSLPRNIGVGIFLIQNLSYWYTALANPGIPIKYHLNNMNLENIVEEKGSRKIKSSDKSHRICRVCNILINIDLDMIHCDECDVCVEGHDHHCPWTSKCIGKNNLYSFYGFVFGTLGLFFYLIFGLVFIKPN